MVAGPLAQPVDVRFNPVDGTMYLLDFGEFEMTGERLVAAKAKSGKLWRRATHHPRTGSGLVII